MPNLIFMNPTSTDLALPGPPARPRQRPLYDRHDRGPALWFGSRIRLYVLGHLSFIILAWAAQGQPTAFTYQGQLRDQDLPATGVYDLRFVLRDAATGGSQVPGTPVPAGPVGVTNGQFVVALDFGAEAFNGSSRWLEIGVRTNGSLSAHTPLVPRIALTATPYATMAGSAGAYTGSIGDGQLSANVARLNTAQTFTGPTSFSPASGPPFAVNNTNRVANLHADLLDGFSASAFWNLGGNLGAGPSNFVGTLDHQPLIFRVNNTPAWRLEPNAVSPNLVGGYSGNQAVPGTVGVSIGGGGAINATNVVAASHGTIAGGRANRILSGAAYGAIGGGDSNVVGNSSGTVAGGLNNQSAANLATIAGGGTNLVSGPGGAIGGGSQNTVVGARATIGGGASNVASGSFSMVAGGSQNTALGFASAVLGGASGEATDAYATVVGGFDNAASGLASLAAGSGARALHPGTFVWSDTSSVLPFGSTASDQFLIRAAGGVGIGSAPVDAALDVEGDVRLNDYDIFLRTGVDRNHGLGWYGSTKPFAGLNIDGPVAYGWSGGALGTVQGGQRAILQWTAAGQIGIGISPAARLHVAESAPTVALFESSSAGGSWFSLDNTAGGRRWSLISTGPGNGETAGHLLFFAGGAGGTKVTFRDSGNVGLGTTTPGDRLEVFGPDATVRIRNQNDALGGFIGNTFSTVQLGLYNPTAAPIDAIAAGAKRSVFGLDRLGRVGSMVNGFGNPSFRNLVDDGSGNMVVNGAGSINFGSTTRQMLNLYATGYGLGVQANTLYARSDGNFAWYRNGAHAESTYDPGGGTVLMRLDGGGLTVNTTFISSSDRQRKENFESIQGRSILDRLVAMPIQRWNYKEDGGVRHIGPTAQDFHAAFEVGCDDRHISMVDADGVALAAIQGLHELVQEKAAQVESLRQQNGALQKRLEELERAVAKLAAK